MNSTEMLEKIESLATQGYKSLTINSTGKDGCKYSAHLLVMATRPVNGSMSIFRDGQHFMDKSFKDVLPVYSQGMSDISGVLTGDRR